MAHEFVGLSLQGAFVIKGFARRIVGWRVSSLMRRNRVLQTLDQALSARQPKRDGSLVRHSDRMWLYASIRNTERLAETGIETSEGSKCDNQDNGLAATVNGLDKSAPIHSPGRG